MDEDKCRHLTPPQLRTHQTHRRQSQAQRAAYRLQGCAQTQKEAVQRRATQGTRDRQLFGAVWAELARAKCAAVSFSTSSAIWRGIFFALFTTVPTIPVRMNPPSQNRRKQYLGRIQHNLVRPRQTELHIQQRAHGDPCLYSQLPLRHAGLYCTRPCLWRSHCPTSHLGALRFVRSPLLRSSSSPSICSSCQRVQRTLH